MKKIATRVRPSNSTNSHYQDFYGVPSKTTFLIHHKTTAAAAAATKPTTINKLNPFWKMAQLARPQPSNGYDRRAQLLVYARELREGDNQQQMKWRHSTRPQKCPKERKWSNVKALRIPASIRRLFRGKERKCGYERIETEETSQVVDQICSRPKCTRKSTNYSEGTRNSTITSFRGKLKCMLKEVSAGLLRCKIPAGGKQKIK